MLLPVLAVAAFGAAVAVCLRLDYRSVEVNRTPLPAPAPAPFVWTQARVDAQFRAMTAPLTR